MIKFIKTKLILSTAFLYFISADVSLAQNTGDTGGGLNNPISNVNSVDGLLTLILSFVVRVGGPIVVIMIIYSGFKFVAARGNPSKIEEAKKSLMWVLIGAAIILGAEVLKTVVTGTVSDIRSNTGF